MFNKSILFVSDLSLPGRHIQRLRDLQRYFTVQSIGMRSFARPYGIVDKFFIKVGLPLPDLHFTARLVRFVSKMDGFDFIWLDKSERLSFADFLALMVIKIRAPKDFKIIWFHEDNIFSKPERNFRYFLHLRLVDHIFTTKRSVFERLLGMSPKRKLDIDLIPNLVFHGEVRGQLREEEPSTYDVLFIGSYEKDRCDMLCFLGESGATVGIYGRGWTGKINPGRNISLHGHIEHEEFEGLCAKYAICLNFFRKSVSDVTTTRPMEYAGAGACILSEYTSEISRILRPWQEAVYFDGPVELLKMVNILKKNVGLRNILKKGALQRSKAFLFTDHIRRHLQH